MQMPSTHDTIVAVSSGWVASAIGIVRLSGPESFALAERLGVAPPALAEGGRPTWTAGRLGVEAGQTLPVAAFWFRAPRSYTGQDVVELHTVGCLPLLRELAARLIELGGRRALPGEFTARAFVNGRLTAEQVDGVLALMRSGQEAAVRQVARRARESQRRVERGIVDRIVGLLALIEAGIDFADEEDVRFITPAAAVETLDELLADLRTASDDDASAPRLGRPHIALAGLPNAGKSTLFNRLIGHERALVSPVLGTTRDVLSAEAEPGGIAAVVQDCAGVGGSADELELACHLAGERAAQEADLVLWVHAADVAWDERETAACTRVASQRRLLVWSKMDLAPGAALPPVPVEFADRTAVSATERTGVERLGELVATRLGRLAGVQGEATRSGELRAAAAALGRARAIAASSSGSLSQAELISLELRAAQEVLGEKPVWALNEQLLDRIFAEFCIGK
jgi:tRNA modification GTPase